ncbi:gliding motility-associated C-terminal domain-containing protein [Maribacter aquivivus]|uniref:T9SS type B sorting domain-containing protein n=1 Tax=Maribacter aquivivus TaxID=228958 RepID=UPI002490DA77|nr:gliding motility-associated C-terminal domain-containing protein [Maribacter aquivivus]
MTKPTTTYLIQYTAWKKVFTFFLLVLVNSALFSQKTTGWDEIGSTNIYESYSSDNLVRVECRVTGGVSISGEDTMGCISDNTYGNPDPVIFGETSLGISINPLFSGSIEFHFFDAVTGDEVFITNPYLNVDKVGTFGALPLPFLTGTNTGVFTSTNGTWTNIGKNGDIFVSTNTEFKIDADALLSFNGGECGDNSFDGTGGGTMKMDDAVKSINMDVSVSGLLSLFQEDVEFVISNLIIAEPEIEVTKTVINSFSSPVVTGDSVDYTIEVENTGNVKVINVALTDTFKDASGNTITLSNAPSFSSATMSSSEGTLLAGEVATYSASHILTANEIAEGGVINQVSVFADSPYGPGDTDDLSDDGDDTDGNLLDDTTDSFFPIPLENTETVEKNNSVDILVTNNDDFGVNGPNSGSIFIVSTPTNGSVSLNNNGTATNPVDDYFTYTPDTDYTGTDSFIYGITDSKGYTQHATVTITVYACPNAGIDGTLNICFGDTFDNDDLFAQLTGSPETGGTWADNGDGTHTYTVAAIAPCTADDESIVTVTEQAQPNAGIDGTLNICQGATFTNADLFAQLTGNPNTGGTWVNNGDGTHSYTVTAAAPCTTDDESIVTVTEQAKPNAGGDGTLNICQGATFDNDDLFGQLTGNPDTGGTWVDNGDGTHTYTVAAIAPCTVDDESNVTVTEQAQPNAGIDGTLYICTGDTFDNDDLFAQLTGSPDSGGTWADNGNGTHTYTVAAIAPCTIDDESTVTVTEQAQPNAGIDGTLNICVGDSFDNNDLFAQLTGSPDTDGTWVDNGNGTHTYTVAATAPCTIDDESIVTVTQQAQPNAGIDGTLNICAGATFDNDDLFAQLTGNPDTGGTWFDNGDGTHTYTVAAIAPCTTDDESIVTVTQQAQPNAGIDGTLNICFGDSFDNNDLFAQLTGNPDTGGTWADNGDGTHTYKVAAIAPCTTDDESIVTVNEQAQPNAGIDGTLNICQGATFTNADFFAQLTGNPDSGGTWADNGNGTHTYTVVAIAPCTIDDESTVTVTEQAQPNAGIDGTLNICAGATFTNADLFAQLTGNPDTGGTWADNGDGTHTYTVAAIAPCTADDESIVTVTEQAQPNAGIDGTLNICVGDSFDNNDLFAQLTGNPDTGGTWFDNGDGTHTYTVAAITPCTTDDESIVTVTQQAQPNAGVDGTLNICSGDSFDNNDLFAQLTGSPDTGGTWVDNGNGTHTYTVAATAPCTIDDESIVTVTQQAQPNAGVDGVLNICQGDTFDNNDLFAQLTGSPDTGGTWVDNGNGTHTYTVAATAPCTTDDESIVTVTQQAQPNAGIDGTLNICQGDTFDNNDLFSQLTGSPDSGGTWVDNGNGTHTYTVAAIAPCATDDESIVTVTQQAQPNAGIDATLNICVGDSFDNNDLFAQLTGSPDTGGTWVDNGNGTHTYTVDATAPCTTDDESIVTVTQQAQPNAGIDGTLNICQGATFDNDDLFAQLTGSPDTGGTWADNGDGTHTYTVAATAPCTTDDESIVTVTEQAQPNAGIDGTLNICEGDTITNADLFAQLSGSPDAGGTWADNGNDTFSYTVSGIAPCATNDTSIVTVEFNQTDADGNGIIDCKETIIVLPIITIGDVTVDNIVNETEAQNPVSITGTVSGDFITGDIVTLIINANNYNGPVNENGLFEISVPGIDITADVDSTIIASVSTLTIEGNTGSASDQHTYIVDIEPPLVDSFETLDTFPILLGLGSPNEILTITVAIGESGESLEYIINTDINGIWEIHTDLDIPQNGSFPIIDPEITLFITAVDIAGNQGAGEVVIIFNNEPLDNDSDNDGLPDEEEIRIGTNPNNPDTDGDGIMDGQEIADGTDPLDACDSLGGTPPSGSACDIYVELDLIKPDDSFNGSFEIINIERFPENSVKIYNRYGVLVWEVEGYENKTKAFTGLSDGRITINRNEKLPSGTYYYDIYYMANGVEKILTGYLYVIQ